MSDLIECSREGIVAAVGDLWPKKAAAQGIDPRDTAPIVDGHFGVGFSVRLFTSLGVDPARTKAAYVALDGVLSALEGMGYAVTRDGNEWQEGRLVLGYRADYRPTLYAPTDVDIANMRWEANCGPGALAAVLGSEVMALRHLFPQFPAKAYTTLTAMRTAIMNAGFQSTTATPARCDGALAPLKRGLLQIQWAGPWTDSPKANGKWAYLHTHWIGAVCDAWGRLWIYDVNADHTVTSGNPLLSVLSAGGGGWIQEADWRVNLAPMFTADIDRASGAWFVLKEIEVRR